MLQAGLFPAHHAGLFRWRHLQRACQSL